MDRRLLQELAKMERFGVKGFIYNLAIILLSEWIMKFINCQEIVHFNIDEELPAHTLIGNIPEKAVLKTQYPDDVLTQLKYDFLLSAQDSTGNDLFELGKNSGILKTAVKIDREDVCPSAINCTQRLLISASAQQNFKVITVDISINDTNDNMPTFPDKTFAVSVPEEAVVGTAISLLPSAQDEDSGIRGIDGYRLNNPANHPNMFTLRKDPAPDGSLQLRLILSKELDRELVSFYTLELMAYDGDSPRNTGTLTINVTVKDTNDNTPVFHQRQYSAEILETASIHSNVISVTAYDSDSGKNGQIVYGFTQRTIDRFGEVFGINPNQGNVYLKRKLDYEKMKSYALVITATDKGENSQTAQVALVINVTDVNDCKPRISLINSDGTASVKENSPPETHVISLRVTDGDSGDNGKVQCDLTNFNFDLKEVTLSVGTNLKMYSLVTLTSLDRETEPSYSIRLTCIDKGNPALSDSRTITVNVTDENDHYPVFKKKIYPATVMENITVGDAILTVEATDNDVGDNARITYKLSEKDDVINSLFDVRTEQRRGVLIAAKQLDYEAYRHISLDIVASDHGTPSLNATARIALTILDVNDCKPEFSLSDYSFSVSENKHAGVEVGNVAAIDRDSPPNNKIAYKFTTNDIKVRDRFRIDHNTGFIQTKKPLDREEERLYQLNVTAYNPMFENMKSSVIVTIYVNDQNDNSPIIDFPSVRNNTVEIPSDAQSGFVFARIRARDADFGDNARLVFIMTGGNSSLFNIDRESGAVILLENLHEVTSVKEHNLSFTVSDRGRPVRRNTTSYLRVVLKPGGGAGANGGLISSNLAQQISDYTIVIGLACGSLLAIVILVLAIVCLSYKGRRSRENLNSKPETGKYNCRVEAQRMLNGAASGPASRRGSSTSHSTPSISDSMGHIPAQEELRIAVGHDDSGRGVSLIDYSPDHHNESTTGSIKTWTTNNTMPRRETQVPIEGSTDRVCNSPRIGDVTSQDQSHVPVCNSCVVTAENDRYATKLVPLTDKEIEIHKILKFLHSQQDDGHSPDTGTDNLSTSDSGRGASVSEDCDTHHNHTANQLSLPAAHTKPSKQVTFATLPPPATSPHSPKMSGVNNRGYKTTARGMSTFSPSSPTGTLLLQQKLNNGSAGSLASCSSSGIQPAAGRPMEETDFSTTQPQTMNNYVQTPFNNSSQHVRYYNVPPHSNSSNSLKRLDQLPNNIVTKNRINVGQRQEKCQLGPYRNMGRVPPGRGKSEDDDDALSNADTTSTMSGSYVLVQEEHPALRLDYSQLRDTVV